MSIRSPRRILFIAPTSKLGGTERNMALLASHMPRDRFEGGLITTFGTGDLTSHFRGLGLAAEEFRYAENPMRIPALFSFARRFRPDLVHSFLLRGNWIASAMKRFGWARNLPWIASERGLDIGRPPWKAAANRALLGRADLVLAVSEPVRTILLDRDRLPSAKVRVLTGGVPPADEPLPPLEAWCNLPQPRIVVLSHLRAEKNVELAVRSFQRLVSEGHPGSLTLIGEGDCRRDLEAIVSSADLAGRVHFAGNVRDARRRLAHFDLLVLPSKEEGFPNVILEAWQAGLPVLSTDTPGAREISGPDRAAMLVSPSELPAALAHLARDEDERRRMASLGTERVKIFSIDRVVDQLGGIYDELLAR